MTVRRVRPTIVILKDQPHPRVRREDGGGPNPVLGIRREGPHLGAVGHVYGIDVPIVAAKVEGTAVWERVAEEKTASGREMFHMYVLVAVSIVYI